MTSETNKFLVRYASGLEQTIHSLCESVEAFCNEHFGSTWDIAKENGASVVMNPPQETIEALAFIAAAEADGATVLTVKKDEASQEVPESAAEAPSDEAPAEVAAEAAPETVLEEIRHEAADLLHKAEHALGLDDSAL